MEEQKKTESTGYICEEKVSQETMAFVEKVLNEELDSEANKEAIQNVLNAIKDQTNLTVCRAIETLALALPLAMVPIVVAALEHSTASRVANSIKEMLLGKSDK